MVLLYRLEWVSLSYLTVSPSIRWRHRSWMSRCVHRTSVIWVALWILCFTTRGSGETSAAPRLCAGAGPHVIRGSPSRRGASLQDCVPSVRQLVLSFISVHSLWGSSPDLHGLSYPSVVFVAFSVNYLRPIPDLVSLS